MLTLTYDLDLQSPAGYSHDLLTSKSSRSTVSSKDRVETDGQTDAVIALLPVLTWSVFTNRVSETGNVMVPSDHQSVCPFVSTQTFEPSDLWSRMYIGMTTFIWEWRSRSQVKVSVRLTWLVWPRSKEVCFLVLVHYTLLMTSINTDITSRMILWTRMTYEMKWNMKE